jgi:hypothetical protein
MMGGGEAKFGAGEVLKMLSMLSFGGGEVAVGASFGGGEVLNA